MLLALILAASPTLAISSAPVAAANCARFHDQTAPFTAVRFEGDTPHVRVHGSWYEAKAIDEVPVESIVSFCHTTYGRKWAKRFSEDLVKVMSEMGHALGATVTLEVHDPATRAARVLVDVPMTEENRQAALQFNKGGEIGVSPVVDRAKNRVGGYEKAAPFTAVRFQGNTPHIRVDGNWYEAESIDGVAAESIVLYCQSMYGRKWSKRFSEDLVEVLSSMGHAPAATVDLEIVDLKTKHLEVLRDVPMTEENRRAAWEFNHRDQNQEPTLEPERVQREHASAPNPEFAKLFGGRRFFEGRELSADQVGADLDQLEWLIAHRYSYARRLGVDYKAALDALRLSAGRSMPMADFGLRLEMLLGLFGDGHTRVSGTWTPQDGAELPFLLAPCGELAVAFLPDRSALLDPDAPYVSAIDGVDLENWIEVLEPLTARGASHFTRRAALKNVRAILFARDQLGIEHKGQVRVTLTGESGTERVEAELDLTPDPPLYGDWPRSDHRWIDEDIGYLRIASMSSSPAFLNELRSTMEGFRDSKGLIIDVRGNGGGSRDALRLLYPYFMSSEEAPQIVNAGIYRLPPGAERDHPEGYLENRMLYPLASSTWSRAQRSAIEVAAKRFRPEWTPPEEEFSVMHYAVLDRAESPWAFEYRSPVAILMDSGCFSATDIFLGAFAGRPNVTLVGTPSGGGSGRSQSHVLTHSRLKVKLSTMVSYRPNGALYDGRGIEPDVRVERIPTDWTGETDSQLDAALEVLRR